MKTALKGSLVGDHAMRVVAMNLRALSLIATLVLAACPVFAEFAIEPGKVSEFLIELPLEARKFAGKRRPSPVETVQVAVFAPTTFDADESMPVMVISATSDPGYNSSIALLRQYSEAAESAGWVLVAADPAGKISVSNDSPQLRYVMVSAALLELERFWPPCASAPLAFGGYSGGAKHSGVLAASIAARGRVPIGVFQGGINSDTLVLAMKRLKVPRTGFGNMRVFLAGGERDKIATPDAHRRVAAVLKKAGFTNLRLEFNDLPHRVDPAMLEKALMWFMEPVAER